MLHKCHKYVSPINRKIRDNVPVKKTGITQYSALLDLEYPFDIIHDVPADEFHLCKEGLTKQMMVRIFGSTSRIAT